MARRQAEVGRAFNYQSLARACGVQKSYLSRVLKCEAHLSDDQLFLAADRLGLPEDGKQFLVLLHQANRAGLARRRDLLLAEAGRLRQRHRKADAHLAAKPVAATLPDLTAYYLDPTMQLVHMYLTIERYALETARILTELRLGREELAQILVHLQKLGLIERRGERFVVLRDSMHLPSDSPLHRPQRALLRLRCLEHIERGGSDPYAFSVTFSADAATREVIEARFLAFLKSIEADVRGAPAREVYQLSFDLFRWSRPSGG